MGRMRLMSEMSSNRGRFAWMATALILAVIMGFSWMHMRRVERLLSAYRDQYEMIHREMDSLGYLLENLTEAARERSGLTSWEVEELRQKGLADPAADIARDLAARKDLVPFEGVLGGTMEFYDIQVLTSRWVLGHVEDGHLMGHMLLEYEVSDDGKISWKLLRAYMD
jgi:hypothetical protein